MKRILLLLICLIFAISSFANNEKDFKKYIEKFDVADEAKSTQLNSPYLFLRNVLDNNEQLFKFEKDLQKNRGAIKEAKREVLKIPRFCPEYDLSIVESIQGLCDTLLIDMGITETGVDCSLHVVFDERVNAFCALKEKGFAICLTTGLLDLKGINYNIIMGYVAHEFAHGAFLHHIRGLYAEAKERRKNEILGGIAAGLNAAAAGINAYNAGMAGLTHDNAPYIAAIENIGSEIKISTLKYSFKYSREQEIESDLFAYRYLENLGCAEEYINGLSILGTQYDDVYSEYSDHPTILQRINFLKFVKAHPELGNKKNAKLKKKRLKKQYQKQETDDIYY